MLPLDLQKITAIKDYCEEIAQTVNRYGKSFEIFDKDTDYQIKTAVKIQYPLTFVRGYCCILFILFEQRAVCCAGSEVGALKVLCAECVPAGGTENLFVRYVVERNGDSEH